MAATQSGWVGGWVREGKLVQCKPNRANWEWVEALKRAE